MLGSTAMSLSFPYWEFLDLLFPPNVEIWLKEKTIAELSLNPYNLNPICYGDGVR